MRLRTLRQDRTAALLSVALRPRKSLLVLLTSVDVQCQIRACALTPLLRCDSQILVEETLPVVLVIDDTFYFKLTPPRARLKITRLADSGNGLNAHMAATAAMPRHGQSATEICTKDNEEHSLQTFLHKKYFAFREKCCLWKSAVGVASSPLARKRFLLACHSSGLSCITLTFWTAWSSASIQVDAVGQMFLHESSDVPGEAVPYAGLPGLEHGTVEVLLVSAEMTLKDHVLETAEMAPKDHVLESPEMAPKDHVLESSEMAPKDHVLESAEMAPKDHVLESADLFGP